MKNILIVLILLLTVATQGQVTEYWNLDVDSYTHNSSNYATKSPPVEIASFSDGDRVVLSQKGTLIKFNSKGEINWRKEISTCAQQRILVDEDDNLFHSCGTQITKFDLSGEVIWSKNYSSIFGKKYLTFNAITSYKDRLYIAGRFFHSKLLVQLSIDANGKVLWKTKFKQGVAYEFSFLPPQQILLYHNRIYILAHAIGPTNSFLYSSDLRGKKRRETQFDYKIKKLKIQSDSLFALGHLANSKDKLIFTTLDKGLKVLNWSELKLPRNYDYEKAIRSWATIPPTKEEFEKEYVTSYALNDFEFLGAHSLLVTGHSHGKPWIINWDLNSGITWNWDVMDNRYYKFNNHHTLHFYNLHSIERVGNRFLISGISQEEDNFQDSFLIYLNLFVREIGVTK